MQANDWARAASHLAPECAVDWPCSGERIVGRDNFAAIQARYPTNTGRWSFDVHRLVAGGDTVVSEVTVTDSEQFARLIDRPAAGSSTEHVCRSSFGLRDGVPPWAELRRPSRQGARRYH
jgi:hypothetical protein